MDTTGYDVRVAFIRGTGEPVPYGAIYLQRDIPPAARTRGRIVIRPYDAIWRGPNNRKGRPRTIGEVFRVAIAGGKIYGKGENGVSPI